MDIQKTGNFNVSGQLEIVDGRIVYYVARRMRRGKTVR